MKWECSSVHLNFPSSTVIQLHLTWMGDHLICKTINNRLRSPVSLLQLVWLCWSFLDITNTFLSGVILWDNAFLLFVWEPVGPINFFCISIYPLFISPLRCSFYSFFNNRNWTHHFPIKLNRSQYQFGQTWNPRSDCCDPQVLHRWCCACCYWET